uniref:cilia- and flagella-associated protein 73-like isoform X2 n=1 Tax=Gasterosteus aculeatus aculeatus TaxID=481459 RepID=UPI001A993507|nr:cilia- and flagella-associated protein 73-like isoform X2 [Gasterosteus aculeatus aculeatus]
MRKPLRDKSSETTGAMDRRSLRAAEPPEDVTSVLLQLRRAGKRLDELTQPRRHEEDARSVSEEAQREMKVRLELDAELERLKLVYAEEMGKKLEQERLRQKRFECKHFMEQAIGLTKFENMQAVKEHVENLLYARDLFQKKEEKASEQVDRLRTRLVTLESNRRLSRLEKDGRLMQLLRETEMMRAKTLDWEKQWNYIQETTTSKILRLGQVKMATLNLYEMTIDNVDGDKDLDKNDTRTQLDKVPGAEGDAHQRQKTKNSPFSCCLCRLLRSSRTMTKYWKNMYRKYNSRRRKKEPKSSVESLVLVVVLM